MPKHLEMLMNATGGSDVKSFSIEHGGGRHSSTALVVLLIVALLAVFPTDTFAQNVSNAGRTAPSSIEVRSRNYKTKAEMIKGNEEAWASVAKQCTTVDDACAHAAIVEVCMECQASAKWFKKSTRAWQALGFGLVVASAAFTGIGASTTIANAKVYSTLGGTTGLGAVTSTVTANVAGDQTGLATVNTTLQNFLTYVQKGANNAGPSAADIYKSAPIYAAQCVAAATGSSGTASK